MRHFDGLILRVRDRCHGGYCRRAASGQGQPPRGSHAPPARTEAEKTRCRVSGLVCPGVCPALTRHTVRVRGPSAVAQCGSLPGLPAPSSPLRELLGPGLNPLGQPQGRTRPAAGIQGQVAPRGRSGAGPDVSYRPPSPALPAPHRHWSAQRRRAGWCLPSAPASSPGDVDSTGGHEGGTLAAWASGGVPCPHTLILGVCI